MRYIMDNMSKNTLALYGGSPIRKDPFSSYNSLGEEERQAVDVVMQRRVISDFKANNIPRFFGGEKVRELEAFFKNHFGVKHAVAMNSATTALHAALLALGIGPGDEVITSPFSMSATPASILFAGALPVFADVDLETFCIDPRAVEKKITPRTKAILAVNLFGGSPDYDSLEKIARTHSLVIIEDNAQGIGATYKKRYLGTIGSAGVFSFNVHKHIQSGEGGIMLTNDDVVAYRAQLVRNHGEAVVAEKYETDGQFEPIVGSNYRMSELHAAVAVEQTKKLEGLLNHRTELMTYLAESMKHFSWLIPQHVFPDSKNVYYAFAFKFNEENTGFSRDIFVKAMKAEGFPLYLGYIKPLYLMPLYQKKQIYLHSQFPFVQEGKPVSVTYDKGICPNAEKLHEKELMILNLAFHYPKSKEEVDSFVAALQKLENNKQELKVHESKN